MVTSFNACMKDAEVCASGCNITSEIYFGNNTDHDLCKQRNKKRIFLIWMDT